ncbi:MAG TPA: hypothetical protein VFJ06_02085 [Halococcus sp.]|nr:hypothetical protein [Halococcus sp.]
MPKTSDNGEYTDPTTDTDTEKSAWSATLADMDALAADYEDEGWKTVTIPAGHTAPESPDSGVEGRFGLVYVIPGNYADAFEEAFETGEFPQYDVFRNETEREVFLVTILADPETETAIFIAGGFTRYDSRPLIQAVQEEGEMYTHVQTLDETVLGSFRHTDPKKFFPATDFTAGQ